jgi:tRNA (cmo5U34)-methyltransferase
MTSHAFNHFSNTVDDYDTVVDAVVIKNDELHNALIEPTKTLRSTITHALDLGCGTAHGMQLLKAAHPHAKILGVDFSERMLEKARKNTNDDSYSFLLKDIWDLEFDCTFDCIISAVTIHNLTAQQKEVLFRKISKWLVKDGIFINADFYKAEETRFNDQLHEIYLAYVRKNLKGAELEVWLEHIASDNPEKLSVQFKILEHAGFTPPSITWLHGNEAVYYCHKI